MYRTMAQKWRPKKAQNGLQFRPINIKNYRYDSEGNIVNNETGETGTLASPEVIVIANDPRKYRSAFDGSFENFTNTLNAMTGGIGNRLSPTQNVRAVYDLFDPSLSTQDKINSIVYGNNGIVSNEFAQEHPILSFGVNLIGDAATPKSLLNIAVKPRLAQVSSATNNIKNELKYLFPKAKLYSDNSAVNAYATLARRYNLPDKARLPYLIRKVNSNKLDFSDSGDLILNGRFSHTNFTYDRPVVSHDKGVWDNAEQTLLISPRKIVRENKFGSVEPSDMFTVEDPQGGLKVSTNDVINITANPTSIRQSTKNGIQTFSSPALRQQELKQLKAEQQAYLDNFGKRFKMAKDTRRDFNNDYWDAVFSIQSKFGRPKVKDVKLLEDITGLKSGISDIKDASIFRALNREQIMSTPLSDVDDMIKSLPKFGNNRRFRWDKYTDYRGVAFPYKNFFYDPATPTESKFVFPD